MENNHNILTENNNNIETKNNDNIVIDNNNNIITKKNNDITWKTISDRLNNIFVNIEMDIRKLIKKENLCYSKNILITILLLF